MICDRTAANDPNVVCRTCQVPFAGDRSAARRAGWIPASTATQHDVDTGPLVCPRCAIATTDALLEAMRSARAPNHALTAPHPSLPAGHPPRTTTHHARSRR